MWQHGHFDQTLQFVYRTFGEQLLEGVPGQRATDLQSLRHYGGRDELVVGDLLVQLVVCGLVEEDQVVQLIPDLSLGPLLLMGRKKNKRVKKVTSDKDITNYI